MSRVVVGVCAVVVAACVAATAGGCCCPCSYLGGVPDVGAGVRPELAPDLRPRLAEAGADVVVPR